MFFYHCETFTIACRICTLGYECVILLRKQINKKELFQLYGLTIINKLDFFYLGNAYARRQLLIVMVARVVVAIVVHGTNLVSIAHNSRDDFATGSIRVRKGHHECQLIMRSEFLLTIGRGIRIT